MARVPTVIDNSVELRPLARQRLEAQDMTVGGRALGAGFQRLAQGLGDVGAEMDREMATMDEARAKNADNLYQEFERNLLDGDEGYYRRENADALNARETTQQAINSKVGELLGQTQSHRERLMLEDVLNRRRQQALTGIGRYAQTQAKNFAVTQSAARVSNATDNYARYFNDPDRGPAEMATIRSEVSSRARILGLQDAGVIKAMTSEAVSKAHAAAIDATAVNDPVAAMTYLDKHRDEIEPETQLRIDRQLHPALVERDAVGIADIAIGTPAPAADVKGPILPRLTSVVLGLEGGGTLAAPKVSPKGARGPMQVMPGTNADPGFGVVPARNDSEAERARVGRDYLAAMVARYGNDPARALAAYNGGPGRVDAAIKEHGANWLAAMPAETRQYVANGIKKIGVTAPSQDHGVGGDLGSQLAAVDRIAADRGVSTEVRDRARSEIERRYAIGKRVEADRQDAEKDIALESVMALGDSFTSPSQIPNFAKLEPSARLQFSNWAKSNVASQAAAAAAAAKPRTDYGKWSVLSDAYAKDPKSFLAIRPEQVRPFLDDSDFNTYLGWRRGAIDDIKGGGSGKSPQWVTEKDIMDVSGTLLQSAGLRVGASKDAAKDAPRVAQFTRTMLDWSTAFKAQNKRLPNTDEIRKQADRFLIEGSWQVEGDWGRTKGFGFEAPGGHMQPKVPDNIRKRILRAAPDATEEEIHGIFVRGKGVKW